MGMRRNSQQNAPTSPVNKTMKTADQTARNTRQVGSSLSGGGANEGTKAIDGTPLPYSIRGILDNLQSKMDDITTEIYYHRQ